MSTPETETTSVAAALPDYAPVPESSFGPALNKQGYYVGRVERNLYWVTDGVYQAAFLTTADGVVLFDAPPSIGHNIQRAIDEIARANGASNKVTHLVHTHHHADHAGASSLFGNDVIRIGHEETRRLMLRDDDPARPAPTETFTDRRTLEIGGERIELAWHGPNHTPDNSVIHFPDHDTLMPATALTYPWSNLISGHLGRLGKREDVVLHQQYMADLEASAKTALATVDPTPYFQKYGAVGNMWGAVKAYLNAVGEATAAPVIEKYTGVLAAADVFTPDVAFWLMESIRLNHGYGLPVHP